MPDVAVDGGAVYEVDPLRDDRWNEFVERHPRSTAFHTREWLVALRRTYGYRSIVITTTPPRTPLRNGIVLAEVNSWITGRRRVSLPFSDHCEPLVDSHSELETMSQFLGMQTKRDRLRYIELRPMLPLGTCSANDDSRPVNSSTYCLHLLDIRPASDVLFKKTHKTAVQAMIKRAQRESVQVEIGSSERLLDNFYRLTVETRRRHDLPPQPREWFRNLLDQMGDRASIRVAHYHGVPVASILTVTHKRIIHYKYGCSDSAYNKIGGTPLLIWDAIQTARDQGIEIMDFGRTTLDNAGLLTFKDRWGGTRMPLHYYRFGTHSRIPSQSRSTWPATIARTAFSRLPDSWLVFAGKLLYRHVG